MVESGDSAYVPLTAGLSHEAVTLFRELSGRSSLWVAKPMGATPVWHVIIAAAPSQVTRAEQRRKDMGKILPLLHLSFFGNYDKAEYSNALVDTLEVSALVTDQLGCG